MATGIFWGDVCMALISPLSPRRSSACARSPQSTLWTWFLRHSGGFESPSGGSAVNGRLAGLVLLLLGSGCICQPAPTACQIGDTIYPGGTSNPADSCQ